MASDAHETPVPDAEVSAPVVDVMSHEPALSFEYADMARIDGLGAADIVSVGADSDPSWVRCHACTNVEPTPVPFATVPEVLDPSDV